MKFQGRLKMLERPMRQAAQQKLVRFFFSDYAGPLDLANSKCTRRIFVPGTLVEMLDIHGNCSHLSSEQIEEFVQSFPIEIRY